MSSPIDRILGRGMSLGKEPEEYRSFVDSGGRPQMGFFIALEDGAMEGFLYHNLEYLRFQERGDQDYLSFTHRGTAVTIQGAGLKIIFKAIMRHTLMEIYENDGRESERDQPVIVRIEITPPGQPSKPVRLVDR